MGRAVCASACCGRKNGNPAGWMLGCSVSFLSPVSWSPKRHCNGLVSLRIKHTCLTTAMETYWKQAALAVEAPILESVTVSHLCTFVTRHRRGDWNFHMLACKC